MKRLELLACAALCATLAACADTTENRPGTQDVEACPGTDCDGTPCECGGGGGGGGGGPTYYVAPDGTNSDCSQDIDNPMGTLNQAVSCLSAGDTLLVRGGTYPESLIENIPSGTSWSDPVRIAAYPGETVWLRPVASFVLVFSGTYIELDGINVDGTDAVLGTVVLGELSHHVRLQNAEIIGSPTSATCAAICGGNDSEFLRLAVHGGGNADCDAPNCNSFGIYTGGNNNLIDGCDIYDTAGSGIQIYHGVGCHGVCDAADNIVRNNRIHDITRTYDGRMWGIIIGNGSNNQVYNNIVYDALGDQDGSNAAIYVYVASGTGIYNNTIHNVAANGIFVSGLGSGTQVQNNIAYASSSSDFVNGATDTAEDHNLFGTDPLFVHAGAGDFHVHSDSPARDQGTTVPLVSSDIAGTTRHQGAAYDIGAYED